MLDIISQYSKLKDSKSLIFSYKGAIDEELISSMIAIIENKLGMVEYNSRLKKKIFNIIVELIQNVFHNYQENLDGIPNKLNNIYLMLFRKTDTYEILCGNYLLKAHIKPLDKSIHEVNSFTAEQLRQHYVDRLDNGIISSRGRAGLGIMDIVRKSGNEIEYNFNKHDQQISFLSLKVNVNINL